MLGACVVREVGVHLRQSHSSSLVHRFVFSPKPSRQFHSSLAYASFHSRRLRAFVAQFTRRMASSVGTVNFQSEEMKNILTDESVPKLERLRKLMRAVNVEGYILPNTDRHQSEYLADQDLRVKFISGFSGSNAYTVVTHAKALLWTDGRYFTQARAELENGWELMKQAVPESVDPNDWLIENLPADSAVGFDPSLFGASAGAALTKALETGGLKPVPVVPNLVEQIWKDRPVPAVRPVIFLTEQECGFAPRQKLDMLTLKFTKSNRDCFFTTSLDEIAWLLNMRGSDVPFNPVVFCSLFIQGDTAHLFIQKDKLTDDMVKFLDIQGVTVHDYDAVEEFIKTFLQVDVSSKPSLKVYVCDTADFYLSSLIPAANKFIGSSPVQGLKAIKNAVEMQGMRASHLRDSAAIVRFFTWLEKQIAEDNAVTELDAVAKIYALRAEQEKFVSESFDTIAAVGVHAASPHYRPNEEGLTQIVKDSVFLLDSGGQYRDGTTDVTRTVYFAEQMDPFVVHMNTLVLKGHIDCALARFPQALNGARLDSLARLPLWNEGYDFSHGVGHGVGHFLNVHEGPISIGYRAVRNDGGLYAGQVITIEPGYYDVEKKFGIRIENCYEIVSCPQELLLNETSNFLAFTPLTWVPIQMRFVDRNMLDDKHVHWINAYHQACLEKLRPIFEKDNLTDELAFLEAACEQI